jgi:deoxyhypusine synthase
LADAGPVSSFLKRHYRHFNAATLVDASEAYKKLLEGNGLMMVTLAGAMSTAELGISLAEMIRQGKVHAITCTGANLEEDIFNLVANTHYKRVPHYRQLSPKEEHELYDKGFNRVTDTCIPEEEAMRRVEKAVLDIWKRHDAAGDPKLPHEYMYELLLSGKLKEHYEIDPANSWLMAAAEKNLPMFVPGWEDSTLGNMFVSQHLKGNIKSLSTMKGGTYYMEMLIRWYTDESPKHKIGFFQIGGGIAGDFPICVVPLLIQDMKRKVPFWAYFCQISDSTTSYGSYSGAVPNEKITWGKLDENTPRFVIESDATIVAPLMFAYVLNW